MNRLRQIASELKELYVARAIMNNDLSAVEKTIDQSKIAMTPEAGWPGKNEAERKVTMEKAYLSDVELQNDIAGASKIAADIENNSALVDALEAERRSIEWTIRDRFNPNPVLGFDGSIDETIDNRITDVEVPF